MSMNASGMSCMAERIATLLELNTKLRARIALLEAVAEAARAIATADEREYRLTEEWNAMDKTLAALDAAEADPGETP